MSYDIDEFEALMEASRMGGSSVRHVRLSRSLPSSPISSPKRSPEPEVDERGAALPEAAIAEAVRDPAARPNLLVPPDPFQEPETQANGTAGGARPKVAPPQAGCSAGIRRSQSCRRPASARREQSQISYRQRAHANAWRQHANATSTDECPDEESPPSRRNPDKIGEMAAAPAAATAGDARASGCGAGELQDCKIYRVRSFRTTSSGIVNRGDSFKVRSRRQSAKYRSPRTTQGRRYSADTDPPPGGPLAAGSPAVVRPTILDVGERPTSGSDPADARCVRTTYREQHYLSVAPTLEPEIEVDEEVGEEVGEEGGQERVDADDDVEDDQDDEGQVFKVVVTGSQGVGKTTLTRQLLTSEYLANTDRYQDDDNEKVKIVSVQLDDEESTVQFINVQSFEEAKAIENVDAYVVVFSVTDRNSFAYAHACLQDLTKKGAPSRKKVTIVVANKQDIMRNRVVSEQEARSLASHRNCKYTEVSALLDHKVDELLVGIIRQIRIKQAKQHQNQASGRTNGGGGTSEARRVGCLQRAALGLFRRLFRKRASPGKNNCDNLLSP